MSNMYHLLRQFEKRGNRVVVCSNIAPEQAKTFARLGVFVFKDTVLSCNVGVGKPELIWQLGGDPRTTLFNDSAYENIEAARQIGMQTLLNNKRSDVFELAARLRIPVPNAPRFMPL